MLLSDPPAYTPPLTCAGNKYREADGLHQHPEWQRGCRLPPGHGASRTQFGWCSAVFSHLGWRGRCSVGSGCQWLWVWSGSQCRPRAGFGKRVKVEAQQLIVACKVLSAFRTTHCLFTFFLKALRVSMEEQRQRQEDEARRAAVASAAEAGVTSPAADGVKHLLLMDSAHLTLVNALLLPVKVCLRGICYISCFRVWGCPIEDVCSPDWFICTRPTRLQPHDWGWTDRLRSADVYAGRGSRLNIDFGISWR